MIAALYVQKNGAYFGDPSIDPWDERRDARFYAGPHPVIAHPPCQRWCRLAGLVEKRWGYKRGEDGGTFAHALWAVRTFGGVLEHPAYSDAWRAFGMPTPDRLGGWSQPDAFGGRSCHVEQGRYGHRMKKATWLYAVGLEVWPDLHWGASHDHDSTVQASWCGNVRGPDGKHVPRRAVVGEGVTSGRERVTKKQASATPPAFRAELLALVRSIPLARISAPR